MRYAGQIKRVVTKSNLVIFEFQTFSGIHLAIQADLQSRMVRNLRVGKFATVAGTICDWRLLPGNTRVEGIDGQGMILDLSGVEVVPEEIKPVASSRTCPAKPVLETAVSTVLLPVRVGLDVLFGGQNTSVPPPTYVVNAAPSPTYYVSSWPSPPISQQRYYYQYRNVQTSYYTRPVIQTHYMAAPHFVAVAPPTRIIRQSPISHNR